MAKFYFTYGSEGHPFIGGWSVVIADTEAMAREVFRVVHPNPNHEYDFLWCGGVYDEETFKNGPIGSTNENLGHGCWETIRLKVTKNSDTGIEYSVAEISEMRQSLWYQHEMSRQRSSIVCDVITKLIEQFQCNESFDLNSEDDEWEGLNDLLCDEYGDDIIRLTTDLYTDEFGIQASKCAEEIIENRAQIYRIPIQVNYTFDIYVKAKDYDEAIKCVRDLGSYEFEDYMDPSDMDFEIDPYTEFDVVEEWEASHIIEADEY